MADNRRHSDHFDGKRFFNPGAEQAKGFLDVLRWKLGSPSPPPADQIAQWPQAQPPPPVVEGTGLRLTFVNHSTTLLQFGGLNVLTDPVWSERASPLGWIGPRRYRAPGFPLDALPQIHVVLISHNHYDHLDAPTIRKLIARDDPEFVVPLGLASWLRKRGADRVAELDWWQDCTAASIPITSTPARHFSARGITDRNRTLWCGYRMETPAGGVYFAADTAFGPHFAEIRARLGTPRLSLLPIGAFRPEWFMGPVHMSPADALRAHEILGSVASVAIHFGTFALADDGVDGAETALRASLREHPPTRPFLILHNGEHIDI